MNTLRVPTPHIAAAAGAFADTVLLPGDPQRARFVAEHMLVDPVQVTAVRGMLGYTGLFRGRRISVMGSGIGMPSCCLYATELIRGYGVRRLVRIGTCGAVAAQLELGDLVLAIGAGTDGQGNRQRFGGYDLPATASWPLMQQIAHRARAMGLTLHTGNVFSSDHFYGSDERLIQTLQAQRILAIEMEAAGLFAVAAALGAEAAALLTVSDQLLNGSSWSAERREQGVQPMLRLALEAVCGDD